MTKTVEDVKTVKTTLTVIRAEGGYNVIQVIVTPEGVPSLMRIVTPANPARAWRYGTFVESTITDNPAWRNVQAKTIEVSVADMAALADREPPRDLLNRVARLYPRWGVKASAMALVEDV